MDEDGALLPPRPEHPLGCHNPRTLDRRAMDAILLVLRTGMQLMRSTVDSLHAGAAAGSH